MAKIFVNAAFMVLAGFSLSLAADEAQPAQPSGQKTQEQVIKGVATTKRVGEEKPLLRITMDINDAIMPTIDTEKYLLSMVPSRFSQLRDTTPAVLCDTQVISPYLTAIAKEPLANFQPSWTGPVPSSWSLAIADFRGQTFHEYKGTGLPPQKIVWNGRNADGQVIYVGHPYSYLMVITDMAGNPYTVVGEPFTVIALLHQESRGLIVSIARETLFDETSSEIKNDGKLVLKEVADVLKRYFELPVRIEAWVGNPDTGNAQAASVAGYLAEKLIVPVNRFTLSSSKETTVNERIDVLIQNR